MTQLCKLLLYVALISGITYCRAQSPSIAWQKTFGGPGNDIIEDISPTADGNYILFALASLSGGDVSSNVHGIHDAWIIKMDPAGNIIWQQCYGGTEEEGNPFSKIIQTSDGGYLFITESWSENFDVIGHHAHSDAWTVKLDSIGQIQWSHSFGGELYETPRNLYELPGHRYLIMSRSSSNDGDVPDNADSTEYDAWVFVVDSAGNIIRNNVYGGSGDDELYTVVPVQNGNLALFGFTSSHDGDLAGLTVDSVDAWMLTIDTAGNVVSSRVYGQSDVEFFFDAVKTVDDGFVVFGESGDPGIPLDKGSWHGEHDFWALRLDSVGNVLWQGMYGGSGLDQLWSAAAAPDNNSYYLAGTALSHDGDVTDNIFSGRDMWIVDIGLDGSMLWQKALGGSQPDYCYSVAGPCIVAGGTYSNDGDVSDLDGDADGWVVQLDFPTVSGSTSHNIIGSKIYPNPSTDIIYVEIKGIDSGNLIEVTNVLGQLVYSTKSTFSKVEINVHDWTQGIYFLSVSNASSGMVAPVSPIEVMR